MTGEFAYSSDLSAAGMLWGVTVRSPHAHAKIVELDISQAVRMPGVHAVLTHGDVPGQKTYGLEFADQPVLAADRVRYYGEPVALVAAEEPEQARRAAAAVRVEYELLEPVVDMERATEQPPLHPDRPTMAHGYREDERPNVVRHLVIRHGDPEAEGDVTVSGVYDIGIQDQAFLGPESGLAVPDGEGGVDIYVATQWLHVDRDQVAPCLGLPPEMVRIHLAGVGGAFGGREDLSMQIHGALLALHTKRPVKIVYNREESFFGHVHRHPARIWCEHRATKAGELVNVRMRILLDGGAYASSSTAVTSNAACFAIGPYKVANALIESTCVYTNNPPCGAMRGFGAVQTCFAAEAQMDKLADELGIDPVELRLLNALGSGDTLPDRAGDRGRAADRRGDPARGRAARPRARGAAARGDPAARRRRQHDARRGRQARRRLRGRVQEHLLLGGLRRLRRRARHPARRRLGGDPLRLGRGRPGRHRRDPPGRPDRARHGRRRARAAGHGGGRLGGLGLGLADDVDGGRRRPRRLPGGARGAAEGAAARSTSSASTATRGRRRSTRRPARSPASAPTSPSPSPRCAWSPRWTSTSG